MARYVIVNFPVVVEVRGTDTVDDVMYEADHVMTTSSIKPTISTPEGHDISSDEELQAYIDSSTDQDTLE